MVLNTKLNVQGLDFMKKVSDLMAELGFRSEGSVEVKKAFIKNLIKQANVVEENYDRSRLKIKKMDKKTDNQMELFSYKKTNS